MFGTFPREVEQSRVNEASVARVVIATPLRGRGQLQTNSHAPTLLSFIGRSILEQQRIISSVA